MNAKTIMAGIAAAIATFLVGYLIYGVLLMDYERSHSYHCTGLLKTPIVLWAIGVANIFWGVLLAYIFSMAGINTAGRGFITGFIVVALFHAGVESLNYATMYLHGKEIMVLNVFADGIIGGIGGLVIALIYGRSAVERPMTS